VSRYKLSIELLTVLLLFGVGVLGVLVSLVLMLL
jgi:hypothetical protein